MSLFNQIARQHYVKTPPGWQTKKIKFLADIQTSNVDKVTNEGEEPVRLCNYTDVYYRDRITHDIEFMEASATAKEIERFTLKAGQVLITKDSEGWDDIGIPALVVDNMPGVLCGYHLAIFTPEHSELDGGFLAWLCRADALNDQFKLSANGVTRFGLGQYAMKNAVVGFPPLDTQKRIAAFLDEKTARIDALIDKKQALLERLAEKRQAVITQAVTKGLNPKAPMKPSGIVWLGDIPAHWEVLPIRRIARSVTTGRTPPSAASDYFTGGEVPWFTPGDFTGDIVMRNAEKYLVEEAFLDGLAVKFPAGSVLLVGIGATLGKVGMSALSCSSNQQINAIEVFEDNEPGFLTYFLHAFRSEVRMLASGNTLPILNQEKTKSLMVTRPPKVEQEKIVAEIAGREIEMGVVAEKVRESIELLTEQRSALITAAVTGQIEGLR